MRKEMEEQEEEGTQGPRGGRSGKVCFLFLSFFLLIYHILLFFMHSKSYSNKSVGNMLKRIVVLQGAVFLELKAPVVLFLGGIRRMSLTVESPKNIRIKG